MGEITNLKKILFVSVLSAAAICHIAAGEVIYVDDDGPADFNNIQAAINYANHGDIIEVQPGTYTGAGNRDIDFLGKAVTVRGATGDANGCVIDCQGTEAEPHRGFKFVSGEDSNSVIEGFTITNGYGPEEDIYGNGDLRSVGGSVYCNNSSPRISNCIISSNSSILYGGGIYNYNKSCPTITNCIISNNSVICYGGGIRNHFLSSPTISNCTISNNSAYYGGGISNWVSSVSLSSWTSSLTINNCIISHNSAFHYGGGISDAGFSDSSINNCIISNNSADYAGGIYTGEYCKSQISNCTVINNSAVSDGGGIYNNYGSSSTPSIRNCIIWGNQPYQIYGTVTLTYSNIQGGYAGVGNIYADPCFVDDYHLSVYSPCVDAGDPDYMSEPNETDIDGDPRVVGRLDMGADELFAHDSGVLFITTKYYEFQALGIDSNTPPQSLSIKNYGGLELNWQIEIPNDCDWLSVSTLSGQTASLETSEVSICIDHNNVDYGTSYCQFQVIAQGAYNSPQTVTVTLNLFTADQVYVPSDCPTIREAIDVTIDGAEVIIEPGRYTGEGNYNIDFRGKAITVRSIEPNNPAVVAATIIEPNTYAVGFRFDSGEQADSVIDGLTIRLCLGRAAIDCIESSPTIRNCVIRECVGDGIKLLFSKAIINNCVIRENGSTFDQENVASGIFCYSSIPLITNCVISNNSGGGLRCAKSELTVRNCIFTGNRGAYYDYYTETSLGGGILFLGDDISITNCTFSGNVADVGGGICSYTSSSNINNMTISNCIFWDNDADDGPQIALIDYKEIPTTVSVSYSDVQGGEAAVYVDPCCTLNWNNGNLDIDPCFAEPGYWIIAPPPGPPGSPPVPSDDIWVDSDYHLKSESGRWDPNSQTWVYDTNTSPCIDAGDPNSDWTGELWPHGKQINMGAYGGTPQASMSLSDAGNIADLNWDNSVGYADMMFIGKWLCEGILLAEDFDRNGFVNFTDFAIFANNWQGTPGLAGNPNPADSAIWVDTNADLSWMAGPYATSHDVYFGTTSPPPFIGNQIATTFDPGIMAENTTYYWRIDEVNSGGATTGMVWSFKTIGPPVPPPPSPP